MLAAFVRVDVRDRRTASSRCMFGRNDFADVHKDCRNPTMSGEVAE